MKELPETALILWDTSPAFRRLVRQLDRAIKTANANGDEELPCIIAMKDQNTGKSDVIRNVVLEQSTAD